ncbi:hypothetical protein M9H77_14959 [Catharanthus roseus]|uniref:Uncharacterized protein n=1 Tax=Catharanthus roseus TaxID=4058 RepID=A0ACC0BPN9_CATRO|nr:hypothetical protein M9H77_14959 [Catharanthus roseus]
MSDGTPEKRHREDSHNGGDDEKKKKNEKESDQADTSQQLTHGSPEEHHRVGELILLTSSLFSFPELDQLLDDAPLPFIMQHAARISGVRKRVKSLNLVLKSIQGRVDNMDRILSAGSMQGLSECLINLKSETDFDTYVTMSMHADAQTHL